MKTEANRAATPKTAAADDTAPEDDCLTVCYHPECACRERLIAGCSLPLATVQITSGCRSVKGDER